MNPGQFLTYAGRPFTKGGEDDEEKLMRRIMIARRNNVKDHEVLKKARAVEALKLLEEPTTGGAHLLAVGMANGDEIPSNPSGTKRRRVAGEQQFNDEEILAQMDIPAVEATRSYKKWLTLADGESFTYNQTYIKGEDNHDWLLRKNIWRRMRYRRENQRRVRAITEGGEERGEDGSSACWPNWKARDMSNNSAEAKKEEEVHDDDTLAVSKVVKDAAAAAALNVHSFVPGIDAVAVAALGALDDPIVQQAAACIDKPKLTDEI